MGIRGSSRNVGGYWPWDGGSAGLSVLGTYLVNIWHGGDARSACTLLKAALVGAFQLRPFFQPSTIPWLSQ